MTHEFQEGDMVEYWSGTYQMWMLATVRRVKDGGANYELDVKSRAPRNRIRPWIGAAARYLRPMRCVRGDRTPPLQERPSPRLVPSLALRLGIHAHDALRVEAEGAGAQEPAPAAPPPFQLGDVVEYWSTTHCLWMLATVLRVNQGGASYELTVKSRACPSRMRTPGGGGPGDAALAAALASASRAPRLSTRAASAGSMDLGEGRAAVTPPPPARAVTPPPALPTTPRREVVGEGDDTEDTRAHGRRRSRRGTILDSGAPGQGFELLGTDMAESQIRAMAAMAHERLWTAAAAA